MDDVFVVEEGDQPFFDLGFLHATIFGRGKLVNTTASIAVLISDRTGSTRSQSPVTVFQKQFPSVLLSARL